MNEYKLFAYQRTGHSPGDRAYRSRAWFLKSQGNLRVMHTDKVAGKFTDITFDDDNKEVLCAAKVIDDAEWKLVEEGAYTGFSVGARVGKREKDATNPKLTRWTIGTMVEGSLVDLPCIR
jgi:hypothetical protein